MSKKIVRRAYAPQAGLADLPAILQRIYAARAITSLSDIDHSLSALLPYHDLLDIDKAVLRLIAAIQQNEKILVIGDFDADGATSTALAVSALRAMGAKQVDFLVPNRFTFGYGLTPEIVDVAKMQSPHLIVTVDNGVASIEGVARANALGIDVVVTDHHLQGSVLPKACAIVNPNRKEDCFKSKALAGVGVIFYVMLALRAGLEKINHFAEKAIEKPNMASFLDLVALGTVADVVPLDQNNRVLVHQGLSRIRKGFARPGIRALLQVAGRDPEKLVAMDLGFSIGPRLNAAGRLDDMTLGINCLLEEDIAAAQLKAKALDQLNIERRAIEMDMKTQAFDIVDQLQLETKLPVALTLYDESWHQGVIGLVASRVKDKCHRPVIAFAAADNHILKGSARSINGVHIRDVLDSIATKYPHLLQKFGGHAMAAGLSIEAKNLKAFSAAFSEVVASIVNQDMLCQIVETDGELLPDEFTLQNAELMREAGPWGQQFPEPIFEGQFEILSQRLVGEQHLKMSVKHPENPYPLEVIAFQVNLNQWPNHRATQVKMAYRLDKNIYQGRSGLQLVAEALEVANDIYRDTEALAAVKKDKKE